MASILKMILSSPSTLATLAADQIRSWIQICRIGEFVSQRYGKFGISKQDLHEMQHNFVHITPKAPTELPIDWDHLSMDPQKPGDGAAAGWMKKVELRENGEELWAEVEWTPVAAAQIRRKEYRFISPSFVKDHVHKDGSKIGTTLLAAAITNHPFLHGMRAVTLYNHSALGDLAMLQAPTARRRFALAEIGQKVSFSLDPEKTPELTEEERQLSVIVKAFVGEGDDQMVRVTTEEGEEFGWFRADQFRPADAPDKETESPLPEDTVPVEPAEGQALPPVTSASDRLNAAALALSATRNISFREAVKLAATQQPGLVSARRREIQPEERVVVEDAGPRVPTKPGETFPAFVQRVQTEQKLSARDAISLCERAQPALAARYQSGEGL